MTKVPLASAPKPTSQTLFLAIYFILLVAAPSTVGTPWLIPVVLGTRLLLFYPYLGFRLRLPSGRQGAVNPKLKTMDSLWTAFIPSVIAMLIGYGLFLILSMIDNPNSRGPWATLIALLNEPPISALGFDFVLALSSLVIWRLLSHEETRSRRDDL